MINGGERMEHEREIASRAVNGDREAFGRLYELVYKDLYRFALYMLKNCQDAQDVVSEAVTDAYAGIQALRNPEVFRAWIFKILTNKCRRKLKEYAGRTEELPEELPVFPRDTSEDMDVRDAFLRLTEEERLILSLSLFGGYSSREIAETLNLNDNTVRSKQSRALKKMQNELEGRKGGV